MELPARLARELEASGSGWGASIGSPFSEESSSESSSSCSSSEEEEEEGEEGEEDRSDSGDGTPRRRSSPGSPLQQALAFRDGSFADDASPETASEDPVARTGGETAPQSLSPRDAARKQQRAQGSPLRQALAFRDGSYARFSRPDSADADAAKATLIEASEAGGWGPLDGDPWLSPRQAQRQRAPQRRARAKSAHAGHRSTRPTSGSMVERALMQAGAQAAQRPATSLGHSRQFEPDELSDHVDVRREWGPTLPRRRADDGTDGRAKQTKDPKAVRVMRWSSLPPEHGARTVPVATNGRGIVAATTAKDRKPQKDWIKELYERRQRIAKRGQGNAKARIDTKITKDTQTRLADILGKDDAALSAGKADQGAGERFGSSPNRLQLPLAETSSHLHWRPPRAASAPPRPLSALGAQARQAAAAVHIGTSSTFCGVPTSVAGDSRPFSAAAATSAPGVQAHLNSGKLANLTNRQPQGMASFGQVPTIPHRGKVAISSREPSSSESAAVERASVCSGKAPALAKRAAAGGVISSSGGSRSTSLSSSSSLAARTVLVRRGRPASAAVVTTHSHSKHDRPQQQQGRNTDADSGSGTGGAAGGATRQRRPVSAGPFYPSSKDGANGCSIIPRKDGMSESAVAQSVAAEAARRNATLLAMRPTSSIRPSSRSKSTKRPLIVTRCDS